MMDKLQQRRLALYQRANRVYQNTPAVEHVAMQLEAAGYRAIREKGFFNDYSFYLVDFYLPKPYKLCIEVDGLYHNDRQWYDQQMDEYLITVRKLNVLRLTNDQVMNPSFDITDWIANKP